MKEKIVCLAYAITLISIIMLAIAFTFNNVPRNIMSVVLWIQAVALTAILFLDRENKGD